MTQPKFDKEAAQKRADRYLLISDDNFCGNCGLKSDDLPLALAEIDRLEAVVEDARILIDYSRRLDKQQHPGAHDKMCPCRKCKWLAANGGGGK